MPGAFDSERMGMASDTGSLLIEDPGDAGNVDVVKWGGTLLVSSGGAGTRILRTPVEAGFFLFVSNGQGSGTVTVKDEADNTIVAVTAENSAICQYGGTTCGWRASLMYRGEVVP